METPEPRRPAPSALLEAAAALLESAGGSLLTTSLNKALFYLDLAHLRPDVLDLAREIGAWAGSKQAGELSDYSHENPAWRLAWNGGAGQGSALDLRIAIQQLGDKDPWIHAPASA